jgi:hypothetical protein
VPELCAGAAVPELCAGAAVPELQDLPHAMVVHDMAVAPACDALPFVCANTLPLSILLAKLQSLCVRPAPHEQEM